MSHERTDPTPEGLPARVPTVRRRGRPANPGQRPDAGPAGMHPAFSLLRSATAWLVAGCSVLAAAPMAEAAPSPARRNEVVQAVEKAGPAVVNISAERRVRNPFYDDPWSQYFRDFFGERGTPERVQNSLGSGVIVDPAGYILTNEHVISAASRVRVTLLDGREFWADVVGTAEDADLAVLRIDVKETLPAVKLGSSDDLMVGETVIAIGNPFGFSNSVTRGIVSALHRPGRSGERLYSDFIQTDAAINPGNSGGALLNIDAELVGINAAIVGQAQGIGFAIPVDRARAIYKELVQYGEVRPVYVGIEVQELDDKTADDLGLRPGSGLLVTAARGPAAEAGVRAGDVILKADQQATRSVADFGTAVGRRNVGDTITLEIERGGRPVSLRVPTREFPYRDWAFQAIGIEVEEIPAADRRRRDVPNEGVVISAVRPGGPADRRGLRAGDYIIQVLDVGIGGVDGFNRLLPRIASLRRGSLFMRVVRDGRIVPLSLRLD